MTNQEDGVDFRQILWVLLLNFRVGVFLAILTKNREQIVDYPKFVNFRSLTVAGDYHALSGKTRRLTSPCLWLRYCLVPFVTIAVGPLSLTLPR